MSKKNTSKISDEMNELLAEIDSDPELTAPPVKAEEAEKIMREEVENKSEKKKKAQVRARAGKYITFTLAGEDYGIYILSVKEIIGLMSVTKVPRTPDFVRGVINLRGKVHPVIDLRKRFALDPKEDDVRTPIIIVEVTSGDTISHLGIVVDSVSEVINVQSDDLEDTPSFGVDLDTDFILGLAKFNKKVITLLDIDKILTSKQLVMLDKSKD